MKADLLFRQLYDQSSSTYTYLLADASTREAVFIDTVYEQHERDLALVNELDLTLLACLETHCHADHVTGAWLLKLSSNSQIIAARASNIEGLDRAVNDNDPIPFGTHTLKVISTPGHTDGCISLVMGDLSMVFTGDSLLIRGCGRTDFQQGSAGKLYRSIRDQLFSLPDECVVYPAHDYAGRTLSTIGEEKKLNPRIGGAANETDFVGYMENMQLPHPKKLDIAVPINLKSGRPEDDQIPKAPSWAPVVTTYSGVLEVSPQWVAANMDKVTILDVRTVEETKEDSVSINGSVFIPIDILRDSLNDLPDDKPVMTICRSGKRSILAYHILRKHGLEKVANINGGLLRWHDEGLPLDYQDIVTI